MQLKSLFWVLAMLPLSGCYSEPTLPLPPDLRKVLNTYPDETVFVELDGYSSFCLIPDYTLVSDYLAKLNYEIERKHDIYIIENDDAIALFDGSNLVGLETIPAYNQSLSVIVLAHGCYSPLKFQLKLYWRPRGDAGLGHLIVDVIDREV